MNISDYVAYIDQMGRAIGKIVEIKPKTLKVQYFYLWTTDTIEKMKETMTFNYDDRWLRTVNKNDIKFITSSVDEMIEYVLNQDELDKFYTKIVKKIKNYDQTKFDSIEEIRIAFEDVKMELNNDRL